MLHLTFTGPLAGQTFCGAPRQAGGDYAHANYSALLKAAYRAKVCPACLAAWDQAGEDLDKLRHRDD